MGQVVFQTVDRMSQLSSMQIHADDAALAADVIALAGALNAVILGSAVKGSRTTTIVDAAGSAEPPADPDADRGRKWLFRVQSNAGADAGKIYTHEFGTADNSVLPSASSDFIDLSAGVGLALKTEWETLWESPIGSAGTLLSVQNVTRTD